MMKLFSLILLPVSLLLGSLTAQEEDVPPKHFRFIPLGELPVWEEELRDGIRKGIKPPEGSMPPRELAIISGEAETIPFGVTLRTFSERLTIDGATPQLILKKGKAETAENWLTSRIPGASLNLGVLYRDPATMNWGQPKVLFLNDTPTAFPGGQVRFANVSDRVVLVQIGDPNARPTPPIFGVRPGKTTLKPLKPGNNQIRVGYLQGQQKRWIWTNQVRMLQNQRLQAFFYKAQGDDPRQAVKFHFTPEPVPKK